MDIQLLLNTVLVVLVITLTVATCYFVVVLKDLRETIKKSNAVLDNVHKVTNVISDPITSLTGLVAIITAGMKAFKNVKNSKQEEEE